jgi:hypothetical protein
MASFLQYGRLPCLRSGKDCVEPDCWDNRRQNRSYFSQVAHAKQLDPETATDKFEYKTYEHTVSICYTCLHVRRIETLRNCPACDYVFCTKCVRDWSDVCSGCDFAGIVKGGTVRLAKMPTAAKLAGTGYQPIKVGETVVYIGFEHQLGAGDIGTVFPGRMPDGGFCVVKMILTGPTSRWPIMQPSNPLWEICVNVDMQERGVTDGRYMGQMIAYGRTISCTKHFDTDVDTSYAVYPYLGFLASVFVPRGKNTLGGTVRARAGPMPVAIALGHIMHAVDIIRYLRDNNIRHTDLFCGNMIMCEDDTLRAFDFGYACSTDDHSVSAQWSRSHPSSITELAGDESMDQVDIAQWWQSVDMLLEATENESLAREALAWAKPLLAYPKMIIDRPKAELDMALTKFGQRAEQFLQEHLLLNSRRPAQPDDDDNAAKRTKHEHAATRPRAHPDDVQRKYLGNGIWMLTRHGRCIGYDRRDPVQRRASAM